MKYVLAIFALLVLITIAVVILPLAAIWSLNTLFALNIPTTFETWTAALILGLIINIVVGTSSKISIKSK